MKSLKDCLLSLVEYAFLLKFGNKESEMEINLHRFSGVLSIFLIIYHLFFMMSVAWELEKIESDILGTHGNDQTLYENVV